MPASCRFSRSGNYHIYKCYSVHPSQWTCLGFLGYTEFSSISAGSSPNGSKALANPQGLHTVNNTRQPQVGSARPWLPDLELSLAPQAVQGSPYLLLGTIPSSISFLCWSNTLLEFLLFSCLRSVVPIWIKDIEHSAEDKLQRESVDHRR